MDPEARHGHKSRARTFDGYKAHLAIDPDDELITNVTVTPANSPDRDVVDDLLAEPVTPSGDGAAVSAEPVTVFGDSAYADGATLDKLAEAGHEVFAKVPPVRNSKGYSKDEFRIDPDAGTVGCPAGHTAPIRIRRSGGGGQARFAPWCTSCPLRAACTTSRSGRMITIHPHEARLQQAKAAQRDPDWQQTYRATRPTVERKIAHFTRRLRGGRQARCRGEARILTDAFTRAGAVNLANLAVRGLHFTPTGWAIA